MGALCDAVILQNRMLIRENWQWVHICKWGLFLTQCTMYLYAKAPQPFGTGVLMDNRGRVLCVTELRSQSVCGMIYSR